MAEALRGINKKLNDIKKAAEAIDFSENDVEKLKKLKERFEKIDRLSQNEEFTLTSLKQALGYLELAKQKAEQYDSKADIEEAVDEEVDYAEYMPRVSARKELKETIIGRFELLTQRQKVFKMLLEKYDDKEHKLRAERKKGQIDKERETVDKEIQELGSFKDSIRPQLDEVKKNLDVLKSIKEIRDLNDKIETVKNQINSLRTTHGDPEAIAAYETRKASLESKLNAQIDEHNNNYPTHTIAKDNLIGSTDILRSGCESELTTKKSEIKTALENSTGYSDDFKASMSDKLDACEPKDILTVFSDYEGQLNAKDMTLRFRKAKVEDYINGIDNTQQPTRTGTPGPTLSEEPTAEEIRQKISENDDIQQMMLIPSYSKKDKQAEIYNYLTQGKEGKFHPFARFRSKFSKKAENAWRNSFKEKAEAEAIRRIKEDRRAKGQENVVKSGKRKEKYIKDIFKDIKVADKATLDDIERSFSRDPGKYTAKYYNDEELDR